MLGKVWPAYSPSPQKKIVPLPKQSQNQSVFQADQFRPKSFKKKTKNVMSVCLGFYRPFKF